MAMNVQVGSPRERPAPKRPNSETDECPDIPLCTCCRYEWPVEQRKDCICFGKFLLFLFTIGCICLLGYCTYTCIQSKKTIDDLKMDLSVVPPQLYRLSVTQGQIIEFTHEIVANLATVTTSTNSNRDWLNQFYSRCVCAQ